MMTDMNDVTDRVSSRDPPDLKNIDIQSIISNIMDID